MLFWVAVTQKWLKLKPWPQGTYVLMSPQSFNYTVSDRARYKKLWEHGGGKQLAWGIGDTA
jgi:hypothetical protein